MAGRDSLREFTPDWPPRFPPKFVGGLGTDRSAGFAENPPRDCGAFDTGPRVSGVRDGCIPPTGGRGTLRATCGKFSRPACEPFIIGRCAEFGRPTSEPLTPGRCTLFSAGRAIVPRTAGEGTRPDALSGPCGMILDGVSGSLRPANGFCPPSVPPRLKLA